MQEQKQQLITRIKESTNVLVTVSNNPTADQLAAAIGFTLALNKLKKHATAVYSGATPSTVEFLEPEKTFEKNTDSLRDFIISLDRSKADKLRYKVEDKVVKIFISPYRTSIKEDDLHFGQGDFNVDLVVALGVKEQNDLDQAITSHGRILHDATVATVNTTNDGTVGTIHWADTEASSLSEMLGVATKELQKDLLDTQIATAYLTGIVAETERFSNDKTKPSTMRVSSELMAAGANQQLVSTKIQEALQPVAPEPEPDPQEGESSQDEGLQKPEAEDIAAKANEEAQAAQAKAEAEAKAAQEKADREKGVLHIDHDELEQAAAEESGEEQKAEEGNDDHQIHIDEHGQLHERPPEELQAEPKTDEHPPIIKKPQNEMLTHPPEGQDELLGPNTTDDDNEGVTDPLADTTHRNERILRRDSDFSQYESKQDDKPADEHPAHQPEEPTPEESADESVPAPEKTEEATPAETATQSKEKETEESDEKPLEADGERTLSEIEQSVGAHQQNESEAKAPKTEAVGNTVAAMQQSSELDEARQAIMNAVSEEDQPAARQEAQKPEESNQPQGDLKVPQEATPTAQPAPQSQEAQAPTASADPNAPPSVPPPMVPPQPQNKPPENPPPPTPQQ